MEGTDYVGSVLDRLEYMCDDCMGRSRKMARDDTLILQEQLERARKRLRGGEEARLSTAPGARVPLAAKNVNELVAINVVVVKKAEVAPQGDSSARAVGGLVTAELSFRDLQHELKARGLKATGKKNELKERLDLAIADETANMESVASHDLGEEMIDEEEPVATENIAPPAPAPSAPVVVVKDKPAPPQPLSVNKWAATTSTTPGVKDSSSSNNKASEQTREVEPKVAVVEAPALSASLKETTEKIFSPTAKRAVTTSTPAVETVAPAPVVVAAAVDLPKPTGSVTVLQARSVVSEQAAPQLAAKKPEVVAVPAASAKPPPPPPRQQQQQQQQEPPPQQDEQQPQQQHGLLGSVVNFAGSFFGGQGSPHKNQIQQPKPSSATKLPPWPPVQSRGECATLGRVAEASPPPAPATSSPLAQQSKPTTAAGVQRHNLEEFRARQLKEAEERKAQQLLRDKERAERLVAEKKRKEAEEIAKREMAIKRREEAERRRKDAREEGERRRIAAIAAAAAAAPAPTPAPAVLLSPEPASTVAPLEPKRLTPAPPPVPTPVSSSKPLRAQPVAAPAPKKLASPIDTYEISDREESSEDDEDDDNKKPSKHVPGWATGSVLKEALKQQDKANPSKYFPLTSTTCELKDIFKTTKSFKKRTSSQNWSHDLSTFQERAKYRKEMGFSPPKPQTHKYV